eukprot:8908179-Pyramimonas_sp.AAC.1
MLDITDSENESDTSMMPENMEDILNKNHPLPNPQSAAAANFSNKKDAWVRQGQSLKRWHSVPRLVTFMPAI